MGQSTDAFICYGIDLGEDPFEEAYEEQDDEASEAAEQKRNPLGWMAYSGESIDGVELIAHCSESCRMYILAIAGSELARACRGCPVDLPLPLVESREWAEKLLTFAGLHGITLEKAPAWLLASDWS